MDFFLKFLIFGGRYLSEIAAKSLILAYRRSIEVNKKELSIKCKEVLNNGEKDASNSSANEAKNSQTQQLQLQLDPCCIKVEDKTRSKQDNLLETTSNNIYGRFNVIEEQFNKLESDIKSESMSSHQSVAEMIRKTKTSTQQEILEKTMKGDIFEQYYWNDANSNTMFSEVSPQINKKIQFDKPIPKEQKHANATAKVDQLILLQNARKASPFSRHAFSTKLGKKEITMSGEMPSIKPKKLFLKKQENSKFKKTVRPIKLKNDEQPQVPQESYRLGPQSLVTKYSHASCIQGLYFQGEKLVDQKLNHLDEHEVTRTKLKGRDGLNHNPRNLEIVTQSHSFIDVPKIKELNEMDYLMRFDEQLESIMENERIEREIEGERLYKNRKAFENHEIKINNEHFWKRLEQINTNNFCLENIYIFDHYEEMLEKKKMQLIAEDAKRESAYVLKMFEVFSEFENRLEASLFTEIMNRQHFDEKLLGENLRAFSYLESEIKDREFRRRLNKIHINDSCFSQSYQSYKILESMLNDNRMNERFKKQLKLNFKENEGSKVFSKVKAVESLNLRRKLTDKYLQDEAPVHTCASNPLITECNNEESLMDINMRVFQEMEKNMNVVKILAKEVSLPTEQTAVTKKSMFRPLSSVIRPWRENSQTNLGDAGEHTTRSYSTEKISRKTYTENKNRSKSIYLDKLDVENQTFLAGFTSKILKHKQHRGNLGKNALVDEINFENIEEMDVRIPNLNKNLPTIKSSTKKSITSAEKVNMLKSKIGPKKIENNFNQIIANENLKNHLEMLQNNQSEKHKVRKENKSLLSTFENKKKDQKTDTKNNLKQTRLKEIAEPKKKVSTRPTMEKSKMQSKNRDFKMPQQKSIEIITAAQNNISLKRFIPPPLTNPVKYHKTISEKVTPEIDKEEIQTETTNLSDTFREEEFNEIEEEILSAKQFIEKLKPPIKNVGFEFNKPLVKLNSKPKNNILQDEASKPNEIDLKVGNILQDVGSKKTVFNKINNKERTASQEGLDFTNKSEEVKSQNVSATKILLAYDYITKNLNNQEKTKLKMALDIQRDPPVSKIGEETKLKLNFTNKLGANESKDFSIKKLYSDFYANEAFRGSPRTKTRAVQEMKQENVDEANNLLLRGILSTGSEKTKNKNVLEVKDSLPEQSPITKKPVLNEAEIKNKNVFEANNKILHKVKNTKAVAPTVQSTNPYFPVNKTLDVANNDDENKKIFISGKDDLGPLNIPSKTQLEPFLVGDTKHQERPPVKYLINIKDKQEDFFDCSQTIHEMKGNLEGEDKSKYESLYVVDNTDMNQMFGNLEDVFYCPEKEFAILKSSNLKNSFSLLPEEDILLFKTKSDEILEAIKDGSKYTSSKLKNDYNEDQEKMVKSHFTDISSIEAISENIHGGTGDVKLNSDENQKNIEEIKLNMKTGDAIGLEDVIFRINAEKKLVGNQEKLQSSVISENIKDQIDDKIVSKCDKPSQEKTTELQSSTLKNNDSSYNDNNFTNLNLVEFISNLDDVFAMSNNIDKPNKFSRYKEKSKIPSSNLKGNHKNVQNIDPGYKNGVNCGNIKEVVYVTNTDKPTNIYKISSKRSQLRQPINWSIKDKNNEVIKNKKNIAEKNFIKNISEVHSNNKHAAYTSSDNKEDVAMNFPKNKNIDNQEFKKQETLTQLTNNIENNPNKRGKDEVIGGSPIFEFSKPKGVSSSNNECSSLQIQEQLTEENINPFEMLLEHSMKLQEAISNKSVIKADNDLITATAQNRTKEIDKNSDNSGQGFTDIEEYWNWIVKRDNLKDGEFYRNNKKELLIAAASKHEELNIRNRKDSEFVIKPQESSEKVLTATTSKDDNRKENRSIVSSQENSEELLTATASKDEELKAEDRKENSKDLQTASLLKLEQFNFTDRKETEFDQKASEEILLAGCTEPIKKIGSLQSKCKSLTSFIKNLGSKQFSTAKETKTIKLLSENEEESVSQNSGSAIKETKSVEQNKSKEVNNNMEFAKICEEYKEKNVTGLEDEIILTKPINDNIHKKEIILAKVTNDKLILGQTISAEATNNKVVLEETNLTKQRNDNVFIEETFLPKQKNDKIFTLPNLTNDNAIEHKNNKIVLEEAKIAKPTDDKETISKNDKIIKEEAPKPTNDKITEPKNDNEVLVAKQVNDKIEKPKNDKVLIEDTILTKPKNDLENGQKEKINHIPNIQQPKIKELNITENIFKKGMNEKYEDSIEVNKIELLEIEQICSTTKKKFDYEVCGLEKNPSQSEPFNLQDAELPMEHFIRIKEFPNIHELETKYYVDQSLITSSAYEPSFFNKLNKVKALVVDEQTNKRHVVNIKNNSSKVFQYSGPVKILQKSIWNWEENQKTSMPPAATIQPKNTPKTKEISKISNKETTKKYRYEQKETKSIFGKTTMVTYLVEDNQ